jgi:hypothetical protein
MKKFLWGGFLTGIAILCIAAVSHFPIVNGVLQGDLDAGGNSITNAQNLVGNFHYGDGSNLSNVTAGVTVQTNGVQLATGQGTLNINAGANVTVTGSSAGSVATVTIASTGAGGGGIATVQSNGVNQVTSATALNFWNTGDVLFGPYTNAPAGTADIPAFLKNTGTAGTYRSVTFDAQGRETSGSNPTTFAGYGISDTAANLKAALSTWDGSFWTNLTGPNIVGGPITNAINTTGNGTFGGNLSVTGWEFVTGGETNVGKLYLSSINISNAGSAAATWMLGVTAAGDVVTNAVPSGGTVSAGVDILVSGSQVSLNTNMTNVASITFTNGAVMQGSSPGSSNAVTWSSSQSQPNGLTNQVAAVATNGFVDLGTNHQFLLDTSGNETIKGTMTATSYNGLDTSLTNASGVTLPIELSQKVATNDSRTVALTGLFSETALSTFSGGLVDNWQFDSGPSTNVGKTYLSSVNISNAGSAAAVMMLGVTAAGDVVTNGIPGGGAGPNPTNNDLVLSNNLTSLTIYVATNGSSGNFPGTPLAPVDAATAQAAATNGNTIILLDYNYFTGPWQFTGAWGTPQHPTTVKSQHKWTAGIVNSVNGGILMVASPVITNFVLDGLIISNSAVDGLGGGGHDNTFRNLWIDRSSQQGVNLTEVNCSNNIVEYCLLTRNGTTNDTTGAHFHNLYVNGRNNTVRFTVGLFPTNGCNFQFFSGITGDTITGDRIYGNFTYGATNNYGCVVWATDGAAATAGTNTVYNNDFLDSMGVRYGAMYLTNNIVLTNTVQSITVAISLGVAGAAPTIFGDYQLGTIAMPAGVAGAHDVVSSFANIGFVNFPAGVFWLNGTNSTAYGKGLSTTFPTQDIWGNQKQTITDIGAAQFDTIAAGDTRTFIPIQNTGDDYFTKPTIYNTIKMPTISAISGITVTPTTSGDGSTNYGLTVSGGGSTTNGYLANTNFISGQLYTNTLGGPIHVSVNVNTHVSNVSGQAAVALWVFGSTTNAVGYTSSTLGFAADQTNLLSGWVANGLGYVFTNILAGAGDTATLFGGQIAMPSGTNLTGVQGITGTANQVTVGGTAANPILSTPSTFVGPGSVTATTVFNGTAGSGLTNLNGGAITGGVWRIDIPGFALNPADTGSMSYVTNTPGAASTSIQGAGPSRPMWQVTATGTNIYAVFPLPYNYDSTPITAEAWFVGGTNFNTKTTNVVTASASTYGSALGTAVTVTNRVDTVGVSTFWTTNTQLPGIVIANSTAAPLPGRAVTVQFAVNNTAPQFSISNTLYLHHVSIFGTATNVARGSITMP